MNIAACMPEPKHLHAELHIGGMTCRSCEVALERALKNVAGITAVHVNHRTGIASITAHATSVPSEKQIETAIHAAGYILTDGHHNVRITDQRKWLEIAAALLIIFALWKFLQAFDIVSLAPSTSGALTFGGMFLIGLVAGASSCLAVTGGLLLSLAAKHNELHRADTPWQKFRPLLHFNVGRILSYFLFGGVVGVLGQSIALSTKVTGYMSIIIALVMLWIGLSILQIIPKGSCPIRPPKRLAHWIHGLAESDNPAAPLALGTLTFFLPCGFTQSLQLVALASGSFLQGAMTMGVFALGTLPSLLGLSTVASTTKGTASRLFLRFSGALILLLALFNLQSGLTLTGINLPFAEQTANAALPAIQNGIQQVSMKVTRSGYEPQNLTIRAGVPVRWMVDGAGAQGCTSQLVIPDLNIQQSLAKGMNEIDFTAPKPGQLAFSCSMGMVRGSFTVL